MRISDWSSDVCSSDLGLLDIPEQNLDVDLVVGAVDAGGVVDEVGVAAPAGRAVFDAAELRHAEIGTLADHLRAQPLRVDAQRVVGPVADVEMAFRRGLHVGAYAAEPQQLDFRPPPALDETGKTPCGGRVWK